METIKAETTIRNGVVITKDEIDRIYDNTMRELVPISFLEDTIAILENARPVSETAEIGGQLAVQYLRETIADWRENMTEKERREWLKSH